MSTAARKARKRAGIQFAHAVKVGTPLQDRAWWRELLPGPEGTKNEWVRRPRSWKKREAALNARSEKPNRETRALTRRMQRRSR